MLTALMDLETSGIEVCFYSRSCKRQRGSAVLGDRAIKNVSNYYFDDGSVARERLGLVSGLGLG